MSRKNKSKRRKGKRSGVVSPETARPVKVTDSTSMINRSQEVSPTVGVSLITETPTVLEREYTHSSEKTVQLSGTDKVIMGLVLVLGIAIAVVVIQLLIASQRNIIDNINGVGQESTQFNSEISTGSRLLDKIVYNSDYYSVQMSSEDVLQLIGTDESAGLGMLIISDLGIMEDEDQIDWRINSSRPSDAKDLSIIDTTSNIYKQGLGAYEVESELADMAVLYYYDETNRHLYSLVYTNDPVNYEIGKAIAIKELLSIQFKQK